MLILFWLELHWIFITILKVWPFWQYLSYLSRRKGHLSILCYSLQYPSEYFIFVCRSLSLALLLVVKQVIFLEVTINGIVWFLYHPIYYWCIQMIMLSVCRSCIVLFCLNWLLNIRVFCEALWLFYVEYGDIWK